MAGGAEEGNDGEDDGHAEATRAQEAAEVDAEAPVPTLAQQADRRSPDEANGTRRADEDNKPKGSTEVGGR